MTVDEALIGRVLELLPTHPTVDVLITTDELKDVPSADIRAALGVLEERGWTKRRERLERDLLPQSAS